MAGWSDEDDLTTEDLDEDLLDHATFIESFLPDKFYGDWYQNAGLLTVTGFFSWLVARLGGGLPWVFLILIFTASIFRTSIRRIRHNIRESIAREAVMRKIETDTETLDWLNCLLHKFWRINEPYISEQVVVNANKVLADAAPAFLKSLAFDTFTLGTKPPRLNHVRTFPKTDEDIVVMEWAYSFTPNDNVDKTARQLKNHVNPFIELAIGLGLGPLSLKIPIVIQDFAFSGLMRVRIKLVTSYPHIKTVDASFLEPPTFDYIMKPFGGKFGFDVNAIPGLQTFVRSMADGILGPMFYSPNSFQVNVQELLAGAGADSALGVLAVTVYGANGLKGSDAIGNTVDPYIIFSLNNRTELERSEVKKSTKNPRWNETKYILVQNLSEALTMAVYDFNDFRKDKIIGIATYPLESLTAKPEQENLTKEILDGTKTRGSMDFSLQWFPVLEGKKLTDGSVEPPPESNTGLLRFTVHQAKDLDSSKSMVGQLSPYAQIYLNGQSIAKSGQIKRTNNPVWDFSHEFLVPDRRGAKIAVRVMDSRTGGDPVICTFQAKADTILSQIKNGDDWFPLSRQGKLRISANWKPLALKGASATRAYTEPIGTIRLHCIKAGEDLRNLETIGKVDPYIRVLFNGFQRARTIAIPNTLCPAWNEVLYIPVQSASQRMVIEAMDMENMGKDRSLGLFELNTSDFIKTNEKGEYLEYSDETVKTGQFAMRKRGPKGTLKYTISFFPAVNVLSPDEAEEQRKEKEKADKEAAEAAAAAEKDGKKDAKDAKADGQKDESSDELVDTEVEPAAQDIPLEELLKNDSGIGALTIEKVQLVDKDKYLRILLDDAIFPCYTSPKLKRGTQTVGETGELVIRELSWSQVHFQIAEKAGRVKKDDLDAVTSMPTINLLKRSYYNSNVIQIKDGQRVLGSLTVRMRYFPLLMELSPSESVNNMGVLSGEIIKADKVPAADRSGYSDPYTVILLDGEKVFKTKTVKKTLNPVWNEQFKIDILSRTNSKFLLQVFDWDMGPADDDFLGDVPVDLAQLEPLTPITLTLPLRGESGTITVRFLFKPSYVTRRVDSSGAGATFASGAALPGKAVGTAVGGAGAVIGGAGAVIGGAASGVGNLGSGLKSGASRLKGLGRSKREPSGAESVSNSSNHNLEVPSAASASPSSPGRSHMRSPSMMSDTSAAPTTGDSTSGHVNIVSANGFSGSIGVRAYLHNGRKEKELHKTKNVKVSGNECKFDESFAFRAPSDASLHFKIKEHKSLGRTEDLGDASVSLNEVATGTHTTIPIGSGELIVSINLS